MGHLCTALKPLEEVTGVFVSWLCSSLILLNPLQINFPLYHKTLYRKTKNLLTTSFNDWNKYLKILHGIVVNLLSPNIHIQILQTDLHTFPLRISWETLINNLGIFSSVIISLILITLFLDNVWILSGENWCWSLLGLKGLRVEMNSDHSHKR